MKATTKARDLQPGDQIDFGTVVKVYYIAEVSRCMIVFVYQRRMQTLEVHENFAFTIYNAPSPKISEGEQHSSPKRKTPPV